jgi:NAD(P)-dependent dehydrogenase (short-subunit alcohol dehydrogenase family)/acyl carrier protein
LFAAGTLKPLPPTSYPLSRAAEAFRRMAGAGHAGKIVLTPAGGAEPARPFSLGSYLISGGLGAIGQRVAAYLVDQGARSLLLLGRGEPSAEAAARIDGWRAAGVAVRLARADVASEGELRAVLDELRATMAPLRGVFHAAGELDDGLLLQQTAGRFARVMAAKVGGSWNLHRLTAGDRLDHFVLFSSAAALVGSPGQANYAAANAFMDSLAHFRRASGQPALSIQWGPWAEVGLAARPERGGRLGDRGFASIRPEQGIRALDWALQEEEPFLAVMPFDARQWRQSYPQAAHLPLLAALDGDGGEAPPGLGLREELVAAPTARARQALLEKHVRRQIADVLRVSPRRVATATTLDSLGFDSLLALELRNRLELALGVRLSATLIWNYPTLPALVAHLAEALGLDEDDEELTNGLNGSKERIPAVDSADASIPGIRFRDGDGAPGGVAALHEEVERLSDEEIWRELMGGEG